jgi:5-deoxy-5-amino-3-dehydroquinate synthase
VNSATLTRVPVALGERSYDVVIGPGARHRLADTLRGLGARRAFIVAARPREWLPDPGVPHTIAPWQDGETAKRLGRVEELCRAFAGYGLSRRDVVVGVGGGSTTDAVGLAAGLYHRGVPVVHLPTTLLAQVDASVGGKTAVNLPEGKNLIGTYWQPRAVLCDTDFLETLPAAELTSGYGEIARAYFIGAGDLRALPLPEQIAACVALKARIVAQDEREAGRRSILNYGHTLGHALEIVTGFELRHGHAVGIGTAYAARLARALGRITSDRAREHYDVLRHYGLPTAPPASLKTDSATVVELMRRDKKSEGGLTFVLDGPRGVELVSDVPEGLVLSTYNEMSEAELANL